MYSMIRNRTATRTQHIQGLNAQYFLFLTGKTQKNRLSDVQSLIQLLKIQPWSEEWIWKQYLIPNIQVVLVHAIKTLNRIMEAIFLRRTKDVLLNLPPKTEWAVVVQLSSEWQEISHKLHQMFFSKFWMAKNFSRCLEFWWILQEDNQDLPIL